LVVEVEVVEVAEVAAMAAEAVVTEVVVTEEAAMVAGVMEDMEEVTEAAMGMDMGMGMGMGMDMDILFEAEDAAAGGEADGVGAIRTTTQTTATTATTEMSATSRKYCRPKAYTYARQPICPPLRSRSFQEARG
jgi:hypothetical protein